MDDLNSRAFQIECHQECQKFFPMARLAVLDEMAMRLQKSFADEPKRRMALEEFNDRCRGFVLGSEGVK